MREQTEHEIPEGVKAALQRALAVRYISPSENNENRFPRALVVFDSGQLPRVPAAQKKRCDALYNTIFEHFLLDRPLDVSRFNATSASLAFDDIEKHLGPIQQMMPLPVAQDHAILRPGTHPRLHYCMMIENNCDDPKEHASFKKLIDQWTRYIAEYRGHNGTVVHIT